ncbi:SPASM domain-containing protein [Bradyrhizobium sp. RT10b]|uniref:SPASM domain-containing protein n=1 Tax=unclassified Bradyrhizobium TaxID=2631580 RepID=UPI0033963695
MQRIAIGDDRFVKLGVRTDAGFVGDHDRETQRPIPDHISARHEDIASLVRGHQSRSIMHYDHDDEALVAPATPTMRQLVDADISSLLFIVMGEVHPELVGIIPDETLVRLRPPRRRAGSGELEMAEARQPIVGTLTCPDERQYRNVLLPNGDVTFCCMDVERRHVLGNLLRDRYEDLFEGATFRNIADRMNGTDGFLLCRSCEFAEPITSES